MINTAYTSSQSDEALSDDYPLTHLVQGDIALPNMEQGDFNLPHLEQGDYSLPHMEQDAELHHLVCCNGAMS